MVVDNSNYFMHPLRIFQIIVIYIYIIWSIQMPYFQMTFRKQNVLWSRRICTYKKKQILLALSTRWWLYLYRSIRHFNYALTMPMIITSENCNPHCRRFAIINKCLVAEAFFCTLTRTFFTDNIDVWRNCKSRSN